MDFDKNFVKQGLWERSDPDFRHLIGKKIKFRCKGQERQGLVEFIGVNELHGKFQVTVNRCPLWPVDKNTIEVIEEDDKLFK